MGCAQWREAGKKLHFTVAVVSAADNQMVLDADVLMVVLAEETVVLSGPATTAQSLNKLFYEADFDAPAIGDYQVEAQVSGAAGAGAVSFDLTVQPARQNNLLFVGLAGLLLVSGLGLFLSQRSAKAD
ncbi:MAG: hypothetical protein IPM39_21115 [Chloroflexi bacterium]|nr:hypothetical protein [Chloroflexota bacterium]